MERLEALSGVVPLTANPAVARAATGLGSRGSVLDTTALLRSQGLDEESKLRVAAQEFESILIATMMKSMRDSVPEGGLIEKSSGEKMFQDLMDQQMATDLAGGVGLGLADELVRQLRSIGQAPTLEKAAAALSEHGHKAEAD